MKGEIDVDGQKEMYNFRGIFDRIEGYVDDWSLHVVAMGNQQPLWITNQIHQEKN